MVMPAENKRYTFAYVLTWDGKDRIEIINGEAFMMAPPLVEHQRISREVFRQLANYLEGKECEVFAAPFSVRLFDGTGESPENIDTMVEPDIFVVCDKNKLDKYGCKGAPDLIIEILSPSTRRHDRLTKFNLYQQAGVREYWIVDPDNKSVQVFTLGSDRFFRIHEDYGRGDIARVNILEGCFIDLGKVFIE